MDTSQQADNDQYREQAEATIADLRARVSHYEARIAEQMEVEASEDDLRAFIVDRVRANDSLPQALRKTYRITPRYRPGQGDPTDLRTPPFERVSDIDFEEGSDA